jgi:rhodanese-related sulfurtransferase
MPRKKNRSQNVNTRSGVAAFLRHPAVQIGMLALVALVVYLIAAGGNSGTGATSLPREISVDQAYALYQQPDVLLVDVREPAEWDEYHAPNAKLIPLGELPNRVNELPKNKKIVVVCRSGNRSQTGRDILLAAGFDATSMAGGLKEWYAKGYSIEGAPQ